MKILIVKLSSLGDVVHTMPAVQDIRAALPDARIDWVVERAFAPLVQRCEGVHRVIPCELRRWRNSPLGEQTRAQWRAFRTDLLQEKYDAIIDLQGLTKSALVAWVARLAVGGKRFALANRTDGSSYEAPTRWVADVAVRVEPHVHAVARSRKLCARALGYATAGSLRYGLLASADDDGVATARMNRCVAFVHGSSRDDKLWSHSHWIELGRRLMADDFTIGLPHGSDAEHERAQRLARELGDGAQVWPRLDLGGLTDRLAGCDGVIGVDSGLSHVAVALDLPHVQIYNFDTAWRTGPVEDVSAPAGGRQRSVFASPEPTVDAVWQAWRATRPSS